MVGAAIGLGSILTPYATGPSPIYYGSGYLPTVDYWRLGAIFGLIFLVLLVITLLAVDARGVALSEDGAGNCSPAPDSFTQPVTLPVASADAR